MRVILTPNRAEMGAWVAEQAAKDLRAAIAANGQARLVVATGASQFQVLENLTAREDIDWSVVTGFHLDEYIGISQQHPASFCRYLRERFVSKVPLREFHYLDGEADPAVTAASVGAKLSEAPIDVALVGIGENSHLAFNDPPANFETETPYLIVDLDEKCRAQQVGEGWFPTMADVPQQALTMSIRQIMKTRTIYCSVPDSQKAPAVQATLEGPITPEVPASILREHPNATLIIDEASAAKLSEATRKSLELV